MEAGESNGRWRRIDQTLLSIQYLRAGSMLTVVLVHSMPWLWGPLKFIMSLSVDLFLLISGFIIVMITDEETRPWPFFRNRLERIVPSYWLATLAAYWLIYSGALEGIFNPAAALGHLANGPTDELLASLLFVPMMNTATGMVQPIAPAGWTINYEMMFYLSFACVLPLARHRIIPVLSLVFLLIIASGQFAQSTQARFWTSPVIFEFIVGMWIGLAWRKGWDFRRVYLALLLAWIPLITVTIVFYHDWPLWPVRMAGFPLVLAVFISVIAVERKRGQLPEWRAARLIGDASYSIYLYHFVVLVLADRFTGDGVLGRMTYSVMGIAGAVGLGLAAYWFLERPLMRWFKEKRASGKHAASSEGTGAHSSLTGA